MKRILIGIASALAFATCNAAGGPVDGTAFVEAVASLKARYHIPGVSIHVERDGEVLVSRGLGLADVDDARPVTAQTQFPIASLTKIYAAALLFRAVEDERLSLDAPITEFLPKAPVPAEVTVGRILSHTSQGAAPGTHFYYSGRFTVLTAIIEQVYQAPFGKVVSEQLIEPLGLTDTYLLPADSDALDDAQLSRLASPYKYEGATERGFVDYGASASAGLVATPADVARFIGALLAGDVISPESLAAMTTPAAKGSPYGFGIFTDELYGRKVLWGYGQYDCYSSLLVVLPESSLTLVLTANNAHLADPARLIYGNLRNAEFALAFLEHYGAVAANDAMLQRDTLKARALGDSFLGRYDAELAAASARGVGTLLERHEDLTAYADLGLLHNLSMLKLIARHGRGEAFTDYDAAFLTAANALLAADPNNPYANIYLAGFHDLNGDTDAARTHYEAVRDAPNFSRWWYTNEAERWLASN